MRWLPAADDGARYALPEMLAHRRFHPPAAVRPARPADGVRPRGDHRFGPRARRSAPLSSRPRCRQPYRLGARPGAPAEIWRPAPRRAVAGSADRASRARSTEGQSTSDPHPAWPQPAVAALVQPGRCAGAGGQPPQRRAVRSHAAGAAARDAEPSRPDPRAAAGQCAWRVPHRGGPEPSRARPKCHTGRRCGDDGRDGRCGG